MKVAFRRRDKREPRDKYWKKPLSEEWVAIQRLSVLQAANDPVPTGGIKDQLPVDLKARVAIIKDHLND